MFSNIFRGLGIFALGAALTGCMTEEKYEAISVALKGSASLREKVIANCVSDRRIWSNQGKAGLATIVTTKDANNPRVICQRFVNSVASGRMKYKDFMSFGNEDMAPNAIRVMQGK